MIDFANSFILFLVIGAAWLGTTALVQKKTRRRKQTELGKTNTAA